VEQRKQCWVFKMRQSQTLPHLDELNNDIDSSSGQHVRINIDPHLHCKIEQNPFHVSLASNSHIPWWDRRNRPLTILSIPDVRHLTVTPLGHQPETQAFNLYAADLIV
jgi:hypothetical protein